MAKNRLSAAKKYLNENKRDLFLDEMFRALWGFVSDKLHIPVADLSKETAVQALQAKGINETLIQKFSDTIDTCEFARFAPGAGDENQKIYNDGIEVISKLEEAMR